MKVRLGIDVGGTFTDAVAINSDTYELIGYVKAPTTHTAREGVAAGIIEVIRMVMDKYNLKPEDVSFIAHGTTQATNALLEGDVAKVGIVGIGNGLEGLKAKTDTQVGNIELAENKHLYTEHDYIDFAKGDNKRIEAAIQGLLGKGAGVIVASGAFSVDDPTAEKAVLEQCAADAVLSTGSYEISKLYGLKIRTRTAAINASILPKMIETADMTNESVRKAAIKSPLMIMRCDGGVMDVQEVKTRPILTMLSGPAAGVAGALMYEKISNGIFLEVGGTSTDMSAVKDGQVMVNYAQVGGHKTYVNSLDVRTVGIAGGSLIRLSKKGVVDVGPRSAHIAKLKYCCFTDTDKLGDLMVRLFRPIDGDPDDYLALDSNDGNSYALTVSCAANYLRYVHKEDYSHGNEESVGVALRAAADYCGTTPEDIAEQILQKATDRVVSVVKELAADYNIDLNFCELIGGGGGASAVVPFTAKRMGLSHRIAKNAEVISPIGVALAMVREMVERVVLNPTDQDVLRIRNEAFNAAVNSGANPEATNVVVEVDTSKNVVRAIASGTTELRTKEMSRKALSEEQILDKAAESFALPKENVQILAGTGKVYVLEGIIKKPVFFGLFSKTTRSIRVIDNDGVIRLQRKDGTIRELRPDKWEQDLGWAIDNATGYNDGGEEIPDVFILFDKQIKSFTGLINKKQILSLAGVEMQGISKDTKVYVLMSSR